MSSSAYCEPGRIFNSKPKAEHFALIYSNTLPFGPLHHLDLTYGEVSDNFSLSYIQLNFLDLGGASEGHHIPRPQPFFPGLWRVSSGMDFIGVVSVLVENVRRAVHDSFPLIAFAMFLPGWQTFHNDVFKNGFLSLFRFKPSKKQLLIAVLIRSSFQRRAANTSPTSAEAAGTFSYLTAMKWHLLS